jgi:uncharacterized membrane protein (UPF0127 family)
MAWLVHDGRVLASLEIADTAVRRGRGLLGRDSIEGAMWFPKIRSVHTFGMRFAIDVAFCDADLTILRVVTVRPNRLTRRMGRASSVVETSAGTFARWGIGPGDTLEVRGE